MRNRIFATIIILGAIAAPPPFTATADARALLTPDTARIVAPGSQKCAAFQPDGEVVLRNCNRDINQTVTFEKFSIQGPLKIQFFETGGLMFGTQCLTAGPSAGAGATVGPCRQTPEQRWEYYMGDVNQAQLRAGNGLCLSLIDGVGFEGAPAVMADCRAAPGQRWRLMGIKTIEFVRDTPARQAFEAEQKKKVATAETRWNLLWTKARATEAEQRELEGLAEYLDRTTLSSRYAQYMARYPLYNLVKIDHYCRIGYAEQCARQAQVSQKPAPSSGLPGGTPPSAMVTVRTYDQYGNYTGSTTTTRTDAELGGAKPR